MRKINYPRRCNSSCALQYVRHVYQVLDAAVQVEAADESCIKVLSLLSNLLNAIIPINTTDACVQHWFQHNSKRKKASYQYYEQHQAHKTVIVTTTKVRPHEQEGEQHLLHVSGLRMEPILRLQALEQLVLSAFELLDELGHVAHLGWIVSLVESLKKRLHAGSIKTRATSTLCKGWFYQAAFARP